MARFTVLLAKQDFKFSVAHFTLFGGGRAELLHGHNYRVRVELAGDRLDEHGLLVSFEDAKAAIRAACAALDGRVLLAAASPALRIVRHPDAVEVGFGERSYRFPPADVVELPLRNTSVELLAEWLWSVLAPRIAGCAPSRMGGGADELAVSVEETSGQSCRFSASLAG